MTKAGTSYRPVSFKSIRPSLSYLRRPRRCWPSHSTPTNWTPTADPLVERVSWQLWGCSMGTRSLDNNTEGLDDVWGHSYILTPNSLDNKGSCWILKDFYCSVTMLRELGLREDVIPQPPFITCFWPVPGGFIHSLNTTIEESCCPELAIQYL